MRYKQKRRRSAPIDNKDTIETKINGKIVDKSEENGETHKLEKIEDKNVVRVEDSDDIKDESEESNDIQIVEQNDDQNGDIEIIEDKALSEKKSSVNQKSGQFSVDNLNVKIVENDKYFSSLIDLIPAKIYFEGNEEILESMEKQKREVFGDDLDLSKKSKLKRFKLDPNSDQKISEIANNFYNKSHKKSNSKQNQSIDNKMEELKKKLNEKILRLKSKRGQKRKNLRESKKERKKLNQMRAHKQKGFSKRQLLETNDGIGDQLEPKPKKLKSEDRTDGSDNRKTPKNLPKIYNNEGNIVYSKFDLVSPSVPTLSQKKKNSKKNNLNKLLVKTKKEEQKLSELEVKNAPKAQEIKEKKLWRKAIDLSEGIKVKDNSKLIKKSLDKKKKMRQKSKKTWDERTESLEQKMHKKQDKRNKNIADRQQSKKDKKFKRLKKRGRILDINNK